ncbi:MAG: hypothetical protein Q8M94_15345 [Ignavibacteria bacterium]|nr:hypothetical protein [Ignavibacteria bacterium]
MRPIWYFVGLILSIFGSILCASGIYYFVIGTERTMVLSAIRPEIWWGGLMLLIGLIYVYKNKNVRIE